jgi:rhodanese-related sulfurtransferase
MLLSSLAIDSSPTDPACPMYDSDFVPERPIVLYCGSGSRALLAGKLLLDMGYQSVTTIGKLSDWIKAGGQVK